MIQSRFEVQMECWLAPQTLDTAAAAAAGEAFVAESLKLELCEVSVVVVSILVQDTEIAVLAAAVA